MVLAHHEGSILLKGWTFHVLSTETLCRLALRISRRRAQSVAPAVSREALAATIKAAAE